MGHSTFWEFWGAGSIITARTAEQNPHGICPKQYSLTHSKKKRRKMNVKFSNKETWIEALREVTDRIELSDYESDELNTAIAWICDEIGVDQIEMEGGGGK